MEREGSGPDVGGIIALVLGAIAWVAFAWALFAGDSAFVFLLFAIICGGLAIFFALRAKRSDAEAAALGGAAAGAALLYGVSLVAILTAFLYAMGVLMVLMLIFFLMLASGPSWSYWSCGGGGGGPREPDPCCCCDPCNGGCCTCGECGACDCGCGGCGGCGGGGCGCGGGGCGCIGLGMVLAPALPARRRLPLRERVRGILARGMPHHPDAPEYAADVFLLRGARWCIGCVVTYPVFLVASGVLAFAAPAWSAALLAGALLASLQGISSAGLARTRWLKTLVKTALGTGLALLASGIHSAPWPVVGKLVALLVVLGLAALSALPRARRMAKGRGACLHKHEGAAGAGSTTTAR